MITATINFLQKIAVTLNPVDDEVPPQPAPVDGVPVWTQISGDATFVPAADGLSCELISGPDIGDSVFQVSADADPGTGTQTIIDTVTLTVQHPFATNLGLAAGTPENK